MKAPRSYVLNGGLASVVLFYAFRLSHGDRGPVDWIVLTLISLAVLWNIFKAGQRLHRGGGRKALWHLQRTLLFWVVGLMNTLPELSRASPTWRLPVGGALLLIALADSIWLHHRERTLIATTTTSVPETPPR
ncbi:hypothetical protein [Actomonas aquatica]|uniref:Uncharacterized protein n=1 Tax=Actomonas aquatica TaxID=2866162 RepID=A0ABZ1C280_9BACT|nr:hypothetical protein [Opitutus sp. WL0086]WRQ85797.1 hypothetical protein K1X11_013375 [Opitutus sp. WL0086]